MKANEKAASGPDRQKKKKKTTSSTASKFTLAVIKTVFAILISLGCVVAGVLGGAVLGYIKTAVPITPDQLEMSKVTFIYDKDGKEIAQVKGGENRILAEHSEIPDNMRHAFIAIEDSRFRSHDGVDKKRFIGAALSYIIKFGNADYGGSTITQQLVKNITGNTDSTVKRKVQEAWQAMDLEKKMSKDQILDNYMNRINTGLGCWGVQAAAKKFFNKDVKDLSLAECASIAGVTKSPGTYDPTLSEKTKAANKDRQKIILAEMLRQGYITQNEYNEAVAEPLKIYKGTSEGDKKDSNIQSYFVDYVLTQVKNDLMKKYNLSSNNATIKLYNGGLKIYTTQDSNIQKIMTEEFTNPKNFAANEKISNPDMQAQAAMLVLDPATGQIRGMYGAYGEKKANFTLNRATDMKRQPGSSFKPIAVYGPAIDLGIITPATVIDDVPVYLDKEHPNTPYPKNAETGVYEGLLTIRRAIQKSQNVVAAQVWMNLLGAQNSINYLKKVNIDRPKEGYVSMALGGLNEGVNPLIMAAAYVPFDNKGVYLEPISYTKVTDDKGNVILDKKTDQKRNIAYKETTAFLMTSMMRDVVTSGTAAIGGGLGTVKNSSGKVIPTAGKTGTTNDTYDKWFVGYSPYYVGATWYGYNYNKTLKGQEVYQALKLWNKVMNRVHAKLEPKDFPQPQGLVKKSICIYSGKLVGPHCSGDPRGNAIRTEYFEKGTEPTDTCDVHVLAKVDTSSKDIYGRPLLANPFCPPSLVKEKVFIKRPVPYLPKSPLKGSLSATIKDWIYQLSEEEYCTKHGSGTSNAAPPSNPAAPSSNTGNSGSDYVIPGGNTSPSKPSNNIGGNPSDNLNDTENIDNIIP
ncbi:transglycosylase domain-containing protein [Ruminiclostridium josui]|uniref:transglycosylase domain-containing protein n=2 Tax=Ruminiclostridium josui TaxID=1499 RepID=UPI0004676026|nr:PBP1A family penicillin-binding protein [Ruminiclostridium josui]